MARYTEQRRTDALAQLILNNGNVKATALQLGIPRATLISWRDAQSVVSEQADTETKIDLAGRWQTTMLKALSRADALVDGETDLKAVSVLAGIAADKHLDYAIGRKGATVHVDARTQTLGVISQLSREELRALAAYEGDD